MLKSADHSKIKLGRMKSRTSTQIFKRVNYPVIVASPKEFITYSN